MLAYTCKTEYLWLVFIGWTRSFSVCVGGGGVCSQSKHCTCLWIYSRTRGISSSTHIACHCWLPPPTFIGIQLRILSAFQLSFLQHSCTIDYTMPIYSCQDCSLYVPVGLFSLEGLACLSVQSNREKLRRFKQTQTHKFPLPMSIILKSSAKTQELFFTCIWSEPMWNLLRMLLRKFWTSYQG